MTKTGMVLGLVGGVIALLVGAFGYGLSSVGGSLSSSVGYDEGTAMMAFYQFASLGLPVAALVGGGLVARNPGLGAGIMGASALGMVFVFGFGFFSLVPIVLLGIGALLVALDLNNGSQSAGSEER